MGRITRFTSRTKIPVNVKVCRSIGGKLYSCEAFQLKPGCIVIKLASEFCFEDTNPGCHGVLVAQLEGTDHVARVLASMMKTHAVFFFDDDVEHGGGLKISAIERSLLNITQYSVGRWMKTNYEGEIEVPIYPLDNKPANFGFLGR